MNVVVAPGRLPVGVVAVTCIVHAPGTSRGRYWSGDTAMPAPVNGTVWTIAPSPDPSGGRNVIVSPVRPLSGRRTSTRSLFRPTWPGASDTVRSMSASGSTIVSSMA